MGFFRDLLRFGSRKQTAITTSSIGTAVWSNRDYNNFCKETYLKNVISFRCSSIIARSVASVPWKLHSKSKDGFKTEITKHPILDLLSRPNPTEGLCFLIEKLIAYLVISGNTYLRRIAPLSGPNRKYPKELWVLRPDRVTILKDEKYKISGYQYKVCDDLRSEDVTFKVDPVTMQSDILQLKLFHPIDDFYGAAITESVAREIDTANAATEWNKRLLDNECRPGFIITYTKTLTKEQFARLETQMNERHSGPKNAGKNLIVEGADGTKVEPHGFTPAEMDFIKGNQELARRIALGYGVPPQILGIPGDNTYSNYQEARLAFWEETVMYYLNHVKSELNSWLINKGENIELDYCLDNVPAMAIKQDMLWKRANDCNFITVNEKREMVRMEKIEGGDSVLVPANLLPLNYTEDTGDAGFSQVEEETRKRLLAEGKTEEEINKILNGEDL